MLLWNVLSSKIRHAIIKRSKLKNKANKTKSVDDLIKYRLGNGKG